MALSKLASGVRLTNRSSGAGLSFVAMGVAFVIAGLVMLGARVGPSGSSIIEIWMLLVGAGALSLAVGVWRTRDQESCFIEVPGRQVTLRIRRGLHLEERHFERTSLRVRCHRVELLKRGALTSWKGRAFCLWYDEEMVMVLGVSKKESLFRYVIEELGGVIIHGGEGDVLIADL